jgi:hypothetical protein
VDANSDFQTALLNTTLIICSWSSCTTLFYKDAVVAYFSISFNLEYFMILKFTIANCSQNILLFIFTNR